MAITYSNPRTVAVFTDWPMGRTTTTATFTVESDAKRGERVSRVTIDPRTGRPNKPKTLTYARKFRIVDGDDGKTYLIGLTMYGFVTVMRWDMQIQQESIHADDPRYAEVRALFEDNAPPNLAVEVFTVGDDGVETYRDSATLGELFTDVTEWRDAATALQSVGKAMVGGSVGNAMMVGGNGSSVAMVGGNGSLLFVLRPAK